MQEVVTSEPTRKMTGCSFNSKPVGQPRNTSADPGPGSKVGLVCGTQLSKHHGLPIMVFGTRRGVVLPTVVPLARLPHLNHFRTLTILQCNPSWPVHEPFAVQSSCCLPQLTNAPLIGVLCKFGQHLICHLGVFQQLCAERLPMTPGYFE